ncbi:MAG: DUF2750 domain-containing protein [Planctomycetia bacterium]|nr:DUF2750 domain-containing protein [Planctomycetia bacterium]
MGVARGDDGRTLIPVWPHRRFAEACLDGRCQNAILAIVPLERWLGELTPKFVRDGWHVVVFPTPEAKGVVVSPEELRDDILGEWAPSE